jgi:CRP/FNR family transcriptional regulator, cyclic AMP receptor protein
MKKVLYILGLFEDNDIEWMVHAGERKNYASGETLIEAGVSKNELMILLEGKVSIVVQGKNVASIGRGEMVGEMALLDSRPPSATVISEDAEVLVLSISFEKLQSKFSSDPKFSARFYKALGIFLAQRLRKNNLQLTIGTSADVDDDDEEMDEIDEDVLEKITLAGARFNMIMNKMSKAS